MHGVVVEEHFNDLVLGTHGRGFWILDDITPLQQLTPEILDSDVHLFDLRSTYRFQPIEPPVAQRGDPSVGDNPPYGASINYYLGTEGASDVTIRISDENGQTIRTLNGSGGSRNQPGLVGPQVRPDRRAQTANQTPHRTVGRAGPGRLEADPRRGSRVVPPSWRLPATTP